MATQIAATPILKGREAYTVLEESKKKPTELSERGILFLKNKFHFSNNGVITVKCSEQFSVSKKIKFNQYNFRTTRQ